MQERKPEVEVIFHAPQVYSEALEDDEYSISPQEFIERVARTCYKSEDKIKPGSAGPMLARLRARGHGAMLEHCVATVRFVCDRGVTHELVRHRLASFAQESTRYCDYSKGKFGGEITVIPPPEDCVPEGIRQEFRERRRVLFAAVEEQYQWEREHGIEPQIARGVLPTALKTEIWMTANLREWMHVFSLRLAPTAHPQMREVMAAAHAVFEQVVPELFAPRVMDVLFDQLKADEGEPR
jgi:thymidylate synthase (FAD)